MWRRHDQQVVEIVVGTSGGAIISAAALLHSIATGRALIDGTERLSAVAARGPSRDRTAAGIVTLGTIGGRRARGTVGRP
jgi:hypothetical protein